jgi:hypothetical protein
MIRFGDIVEFFACIKSICANVSESKKSSEVERFT